MSFVSSALGLGNGYSTQSGASPNQATANKQQEIDRNNLNAVYGQQGDLAKMLLAQAQGQGPNLAELQLQQATNQNNQQAAGALASQRGMNPALAQRLIAQQTAANNQNAAGQAGVLRAQQQLASQGALGNVYGQQANESQANANMYTQAQTSANQANAQIAQNNANTNAGIVGGIMGGVSSALGLAEGGEVDSPHKHLEKLLISIGNKVHPLKLASGGALGKLPMNAIDPALAAGTPDIFGGVPSPKKEDPNAGLAAAQQTFNKNLLDTNSPMMKVSGSGIDVNDPTESITQGDTAYQKAAHGGKIDAMVSPGERFIPPELVEAVKKGHVKASHVAPKIPGKAKVKGDDEKNDIVPAKLEVGGVVIPRTKADNDADAQEFLKALAKEKEKKSGPSSFAKVLKARRNA